MPVVHQISKVHFLIDKFPEAPSVLHYGKGLYVGDDIYLTIQKMCLKREVVLALNNALHLPIKSQLMVVVVVVNA